MTTRAIPESLTLRPIGVVRSPFHELMQAPRQPLRGRGAAGSIELFPRTGFEHALEDLGAFRYIWVLFWFDQSTGFRPKVQPPRSEKRRGLFATRSPHRPNPIGLSPVELTAIEGLRLSVRDLDMIDGTPVLDIKPYIPYVDSIPGASSGWLDAEHAADPLPPHEVTFAPRAREQLEFLAARGVALEAPVRAVLELGPQPHAYRRIRRDGDAGVLAHKAWRLDFAVSGRRMEVTNIRTGYRSGSLLSSSGPEVELHREFVARFG